MSCNPLRPFTSLIVLTLLVVSSAGNSAPDNRFNRSKFHNSGNWYADISIGMGVSPEATTKLADVLRKVLVSAQGGYYRNSVSMDDIRTPDIDKSLIDRRMTLMANEMTQFHTRFPEKKRRLFLSLTGHGLYDAQTNTYGFSVNGEDLTGKELAAYLRNFPVDEIIVMVQSCQSGSLANKNMLAFVENLKESVSRFHRDSKKQILVVTPVNRYVYSPIYEFEKTVERAATKLSDKNHDMVISVEEFLNEILVQARQTEKYVPLRLLEKYPEIFSRAEVDGLDPQIFKFNMKDNTPLLLTKKGAQLYKAGRLSIDTSVRSQLSHPSQRKADLLERQTVARGIELIEEFMGYLKTENEEGLREFMINRHRARNILDKRILNVFKGLGLDYKLFTNGDFIEDFGKIRKIAKRNNWYKSPRNQNSAQCVKGVNGTDTL